jgi:hypothetical protein
MRANGRILIRTPLSPVSIHRTVLNRLLCKPLRLIALVDLAWGLANYLVFSSSGGLFVIPRALTRYTWRLLVQYYPAPSRTRTLTKNSDESA